LPPLPLHPHPLKLNRQPSDAVVPKEFTQPKRMFMIEHKGIVTTDEQCCVYSHRSIIYLAGAIT